MRCRKGSMRWKLGAGSWKLETPVHKSGRVFRSRADARMVRRKLKALSASNVITAVGNPSIA